MKLILGTRVYVDFPTMSANIYPRDVVDKMLADKKLREDISNRTLVGGIFNGPNPSPKDGLITHFVTDIRLYNDEVIVELDTIETEEVQQALASIPYKKAAIIMKVPIGVGGVGTTINKILSIECVHIKEDHYAELN